MSNYATLAEFKSYAQLTQLGTAINVEAQLALDAAEEEIEGFCSRVFYNAGTAARLFSPEASYEVAIDDLVSAATVSSDEDGDGAWETTWAAADYLLDPANAAARSRPFTHITISPRGSRSFPLIRHGLRIYGVWGWPAVPARIKEAALLQASRFFKRGRSSPFGIETVTVDDSPVRLRAKLDPDVEVMIGGLRRIRLAGREEG